jgi:hypothetical protein
MFEAAGVSCVFVGLDGLRLTTDKHSDHCLRADKIVPTQPFLCIGDGHVGDISSCLFVITQLRVHSASKFSVVV